MKTPTMAILSTSRFAALCCAASIVLGVSTPSAEAQIVPDLKPGDHKASAAYQWLDIVLEASARDVERVGAMPTILSRQMAIPCTAMFDAWAAYDDKAVGTTHGAKLRRPASERTVKNKETAIAYATYRTTVDQLPHFEDYLTGEMKKMGFDPSDQSLDTTTAVGIGNTVAKALLMQRHQDGANQLGNEIGSDGEPYSDYTMYRPVNTPDKITDPDRWQPFPGYVSGHSAISGACARMLKHFTGSDHCGLIEPRHAGEITEQGFSCETMQRLHGKSLAEMIGSEHASCDITLQLPTFTEVSELAGISRVLGGYHIQADNIEGLKLGRNVSDYLWPKIQQYFDGTAAAN
jgi:hypothetical protein